MNEAIIAFISSNGGAIVTALSTLGGICLTNWHARSMSKAELDAKERQLRLSEKISAYQSYLEHLKKMMSGDADYPGISAAAERILLMGSTNVVNKMKAFQEYLIEKTAVGPQAKLVVESDGRVIDPEQNLLYAELVKAMREDLGLDDKGLFPNSLTIVAYGNWD